MNPDSPQDSGERAGPTQMTQAPVHLLIQQMILSPTLFQAVPGTGMTGVTKKAGMFLALTRVYEIFEIQRYF